MLTKPNEDDNNSLIPDDEATVLIDEGTALSRTECLIEVSKFIVPFSINELIVNGEFFVKSLIFAKLGKEELAANNLISTTQLVTIATAKAILISTNIYAARNSDATSKLGSILRQSWLQAGLQSIPLILILSFTKPIFLSLKQDEQLSTLAGDFLRYSNIGLPAMLFLHSNQMFVIGLKRPGLALISTITSTGLTLSLSYLLAFGAGQFPAFGIRGVAIGTAISNWLSFGVMTIFIAKIDSQIKDYNLLKCGLDNFILPKMFTTGLPIGLDSLSNFGSFFLMSIMMGWLGKNALIAEQVVNQYNGLFMAPVMATAIATDVLVGYDIANANAMNIKRLTYTTLIVGAVFCCLNLILVSTAPQALAAPFLKESDKSFDEILAIIKPLFIIVGFLNIGEMVRNISSGGLRGFYDTAIPVLITIILFWGVGLPLSYILDSVLKMDANGIFLGRTIASACASGAILYRWTKKSDNPAQSIKEGEAGLLIKFSAVFSNCCLKTNTSDASKINSLNSEEELATTGSEENHETGQSVI